MRGGCSSKMTMKFSTGEEPPVDLMAETEKMYREAAEGLAMAVQAARLNPAEDAKTVVQAVRELKAAFHTVMEERNKLDKLRNKTAGVIGATLLDLDAARDEIGCRLACLRDAGEGD